MKDFFIFWPENLTCQNAFIVGASELFSKMQRLGLRDWPRSKLRPPKFFCLEVFFFGKLWRTAKLFQGKPFCFFFTFITIYIQWQYLSKGQCEIKLFLWPISEINSGFWQKNGDFEKQPTSVFRPVCSFTMPRFSLQPFGSIHLFSWVYTGKLVFDDAQKSSAARSRSPPKKQQLRILGKHYFFQKESGTFS